MKVIVSRVDDRFLYKLFEHEVPEILAQTFTDWELLIIDDGSETDETQKIAEAYCNLDSRIHYTYRPPAWRNRLKKFLPCRTW